MANIIERLGLANEVKEINLGKSFSNGGNTYFHTFRYDFKPASVDPKKVAAVDIGEKNQVTVSVPYVDKGSGSGHAVFKGSKKPYSKECVLIIDHKTGEITLEKLSYNVQLKKTRAEGSSKIKQNVLENNLGSNIKRVSPIPRGSPKEKSSSSSNLKNWSSHFAVTPSCSPLPKSPNSQPSPPDRTSPSVPSTIPLPTFNSDVKHSSLQVPLDQTMNNQNHLKEDIAMDDTQVGILSSSESSSEESSSSESESSDNEELPHPKPKISNPGISGNLNHNAGSNSTPNSHATSFPFSHLPTKFNDLNEDLKLSDSDSD